MLELKNICFTRNNKKILDNINLKLEDGKFIVVTGPNGSGKSTLAKIIMGIEKPDEGQIILNGEDISNNTIDERANLGIGFAFQQPVRFKGITVYDLICLSIGKKVTHKEACDILVTVGLCARDYIHRQVDSSLSGGEIKRIEIASVAVRKTKFTIFDEPEAGIDLWSFQSLIQVFEKMQKEVKGTNFIISHQERILNIADDIILMKDGKIEEMAQKQEMLKKVLGNTKCQKLIQEVGYNE